MIVWIHSPFDNLPQEGFRRERYVLMAEAFVNAGHKVVYWTMDFNHGTKAKRKLNDATIGRMGREISFRLIPVPIYRKNVSLARVFSHLAYAHRLASAVRAEADIRRPDLVISATPTLGAAEVMRKIARQLGAKFVIDIQDAWPETFYRLLPCGFSWIGKGLFLGLQRTARRLYRDADLVTGVSERYRAISEREDFYLAYHGIAVRTAEPSVVRASTSALSLLYLGNLGEGYDLETVIEAVARRTDLTLDIAGRGPKESKLRELVQTLHLGDRVRFHGYLGADELERLAAKCEVGVVPMRDDSWVGLPYKLGDYLAAGLKVVSSLHGECGRLLAKERAGTMYDFGSVESLTQALEGLSLLPEGRPHLPDELRADAIYAKYVERVRSALRI